MTSVAVLREAEVELWEAVAYYDDKAPGLGVDFQKEVERVVESIAQHPERWPLRADGTRRCLVQRFPYLVAYTCHADCVWIIAFAHCRRQPRYWGTRTENAPPT